MVDNIVNRIIKYQIKEDMIIDSNVNLLRYGYCLLIIRLASYLLICLLTILCRTYIETLIFLIAFIPLRQYSGGYHLNTPFKCLLVSGILLLLVGEFMKTDLSKVNMPIQFTLFICIDIFICILAPVDCKNKCLNQFEVKEYRIRTIIIILNEFIVYVIMYKLNLLIICSGIWIAHFVVVVSLIIGRKHCKYY